MGSPTGVTLSPPADPLSTPRRNRKGAEGYVAVGRWAQVAVYATHHATEALAVADRVAVLAAGKVVPVGTPEQVYECPVDLDVARLTGPVSLVEPDQLSGPSPVGPAQLVRPDWVSFGGDVSGSSSTSARKEHTDYAVDVAEGTLLVRETGQNCRIPGATVGISIHRT